MMTPYSIVYLFPVFSWPDSAIVMLALLNNDTKAEPFYNSLQHPDVLLISKEPSLSADRKSH